MLLVVCNSKYCFILHDTEQFGSNNDSGIPKKIRSSLSHSGIPGLIKNYRLDIPSPSTYKSCTLLGDEIFPLKTWLLRSFPGKLTEIQKIFNYRLSKGRRAIGNTFGVLGARWRIVHTQVRARVQNV